MGVDLSNTRIFTYLANSDVVHSPPMATDATILMFKFHNLLTFAIENGNLK